MEWKPLTNVAYRYGVSVAIRKYGEIVAVSLLSIFAVVDAIRDFVVNDTAYYYSEQPHRLLIVAVVGMVGGVTVFLFYRLPSRWRYKIKLLTLGSTAGFVTLAVGYFVYDAVRFSFAASYLLPFTLLYIGAIAALLWFQFYQNFKSRSR
jgi:hypothetical protein